MQADLRAFVEGAIPFIFNQQLTETDREMLVDQMLGVGANAAACSHISQSVCDYRDLIGTCILPTLCV